MEVYGLLASGYGDWPIIKQIAWLLGQVMNGIFNVLSKIGIENIGVCIIIFTIIIYTLMIPLTIKQQKFSKMSAVMQPEIKKIQKKYEGKKDQASMTARCRLPTRWCSTTSRSSATKRRSKARGISPRAGRTPPTPR